MTIGGVYILQNTLAMKGEWLLGGKMKRRRDRRKLHKNRVNWLHWGKIDRNIYPWTIVIFFPIGWGWICRGGSFWRQWWRWPRRTEWREWRGGDRRRRIRDRFGNNLLSLRWTGYPAFYIRYTAGYQNSVSGLAECEAYVKLYVQEVLTHFIW